MNVERREKCFVIGQRDHILDLAKSHGLLYPRISKAPLPSGLEGLDSEIIDKSYEYKVRSLIGSLLYVAETSRPDIEASVNILSKYLTRPSAKLFEFFFVLRYLVSTQNLMLELGNRNGTVIEAFVDADFGSDTITRKSRSGFVILVFGSSVIWNSRQQQTVSLSSAESEYIALAEAISEVIGLKNLLSEFGVKMKEPTLIHVDNQAALKMAENGTTRVKHIDVKYHFIRDHIKNGNIRLTYVSTNLNVADVFTKVNPIRMFCDFCNHLGLIN